MQNKIRDCEMEKILLLFLAGLNGSPLSISTEAIARAAQFPTVQSKIGFVYSSC